MQQTQELLEEKLSLNAAGSKCTTDDLFKVLVGVAATKRTVEAVCADLVGTPDPQTIRGYVNAQLRVEELAALEQQLNAALAAEVPAPVRRQSQEVAIDYPDRPYYGKGEPAHELGGRGKAKDGTTRVYRVATAYLLLNGLRVTLALRFVLPDDDTVSVVDCLLTRVHAQGIRVSWLLLDKGFESIALMEYLTRQGQAALIACPIRGTPGGTRALCQGRKSYVTRHTFKDKRGQEVTASVLVCRVFSTARRTQRLHRQAEWLLFIELGLPLAPRYARHLYRRRFGIETRYRCEGQVRGGTTTKNPAYRFVLLALAFVLLNVWLLLRWRFTQVPRRGGRWLDTTRFPLLRFVHFLQRALETWYGGVQAIAAPALPHG